MTEAELVYGRAVKRQGAYGYNINGSFVDERDIPHDVRPWRAFRRSIPYRSDGAPDPDVLQGVESFWANSHYLVFKRVIPQIDDPTQYIVHLSMRTVENDVRHDWREMQRVKNELCGPEWEGIELYPAESRLVDTANQYHLWVFPFRLGLGFATSLVMDADETGPGDHPDRRQRPFRKD